MPASLNGPQMILHVEDSDADAEVVSHLLRSTSFTLKRVRSYGELMDFQGVPDLILLDLRIPGSNKPMRLVQDTVRRFRGSAVILVTDLGDDDGAEFSVHAMKLGVQSRLLKSTFDAKRLILSIREAYEQKQHMRRQIEQSRSDMRTTPESMRDVFETIMSEVSDGQMARIKSMEERIIRRFKRLGIDDTTPQDPIFAHIDKSVDLPVTEDEPGWNKSWTSTLDSFASNNKLLMGAMKWVLGLLVAGYIAASEYVAGMHDKVYEIHEAVEEIQKTQEAHDRRAIEQKQNEP